MSDEPLRLRSLREHLEAALGPSRAGAVLFDALGLWAEGTGRVEGALPANRDELLELLDGELTQVLDEELGAQRARALAAELSDLLTEDEGAPTMPHVVIDVELPTAESDASGVQKVFREEERVTESVALPESMLRVLVLSGSGGFAEHLRAVLGDGVHIVTGSRFDEMVDGLADTPDVVLVDGGNPPLVNPDEIVGAIAVLPKGVWRTVWGVNLNYRRSSPAATSRP